jgi:hypothetical protein
MRLYLSETSIGISRKKRLATRAKIFTLTEPGHDSGDFKEGQNNEGEEGEEDREEKSREEEEEVGRRVHPLRSVSPLRLACVVGVIWLLSSSVAAHAASITNRDDRDHKLTIIEGDTRTDHVVKPSQVLTGVCGKGCTLRLDDEEDDEYQLEGEDVVSIEEDSLYYDTPDTPGTPAPAPAPKEGQKG